MGNRVLSGMVDEAKRMATIRGHIRAVEEGVEVICGQLHWLDEHSECPQGVEQENNEAAKIMMEELDWFKSQFEARAHNMIIRLAALDEVVDKTEALDEVNRILKGGADGKV